MARRSTTPTSAESSIISPRPIRTSPGCLALDVTIQCTPSAGCRDRRATPAGIAASTAGSAAIASVHVSGRSRKVYWGRHRVCTTIPAHHGLDYSDAFLEPTFLEPRFLEPTLAKQFHEHQSYSRGQPAGCQARSV